MAGLIFILIILIFLLVFPFFSKKTSVPPVITGVVTAFSVMVCKQWNWVLAGYSFKAILISASVIILANVLYAQYYKLVFKKTNKQ
jgi:hypothetical protein